MATHQEVLDALGEPTRRAILESLQSGPASVATLAQHLPVSRPAVSQHLRVLKDSGLVSFDQIGTSHVYRLDREGLEALRHWLEDFWDTALTSFATHAELAHRKEGPNMTTAGIDIAPLVKTVVIPQEQSSAFTLFTRDIARWWPLVTHSVGLDEATDVRCGSGVGEPIMETMRDGRTAEWGRILSWEPPDRVSFTWHPGSPAVEAGRVEVTFVGLEDGTRVTLTHSGWENRPDGMQARTAYDSGWELVLGCYVRGAAPSMP